MASRRLLRHLFLHRQPFFLHLTSQQVSSTRLRFPSTNGCSGYRRFGVFNQFSKQVKGEANRNQEFQQSVKELKEKAEELKGVKDVLKVRIKKTTEQLYKHVDGVWTEAEATAKKVSANVKDNISAAKEEVRETFKVGREESSESAGTSDTNGTDVEDDRKASSGEEMDKKSGTREDEETLFGKFKSSIPSSKVSLAFQRLKVAKVTNFVKNGYDVLKDELYSNPNRRKHLEYTPPPSFKGEMSTRTDIIVLPAKQSRWSKKWETFREKMQGHPLFKRFAGFSEPVVTKSQEIAQDMQERWETSDNPIVHKIQDVSDTIFQETDAAASFKEICRRDPSFSLMDFVAEIQEAVRPVLNAYMKRDLENLKKYCCPEVIARCEAEHKAFQSHGISFDNKRDLENLKKYCCPEVIARCEAEHKAFQSHGISFDNKILHVSEVEVRETKMMGTSPIIIVAFQTQQVHCVCDRNGAVTEGGKDTIHTVYYAWAMQQLDPEELGEGAIYPIWKLREMQQVGLQALI